MYPFHVPLLRRSLSFPADPCTMGGLSTSVGAPLPPRHPSGVPVPPHLCFSSLPLSPATSYLFAWRLLQCP